MSHWAERCSTAENYFPCLNEWKKSSAPVLIDSAIAYHYADVPLPVALERRQVPQSPQLWPARNGGAAFSQTKHPTYLLLIGPRVIIHIVKKVEIRQ